MVAEDPKNYMTMNKGLTSEYNSPRTTTRVPEEDLILGKKSANTAQTTPLFDWQ